MLLIAQARGSAKAPDEWDWEFAREHFPTLLEGLWVTVQITILGVGLAMVLGLVLALLRRSRRRIVRWPVGAAVEFIRSTPLLIQLFFLFYVLPVETDIVLSPFTTAVFALAVHYGCYTSETYRAGIESVPRGQWEAATAVNLSRVQAWRHVILPQAIPMALPALGNYAVAGFKDAPLAATITVIGVLGAAQGIEGDTFRSLEVYTIAGLLFLAVSLPAAGLVRLLERRYAFQRN